MIKKNKNSSILLKYGFLLIILVFIILYYVYKYRVSIRICSWNMEFFGVNMVKHNTELYYRNVIFYMRQVDADILCLQEISSIDNIKLLENMLGNYKLIVDTEEIKKKIMFNVFLVKKHIDIIEFKTHTSKIIALTVFDPAIRQPITIYNCHLKSDHSGINNITRERELRFLITKITTSNVIITGDFNCVSKSNELKILTKKSYINLFDSYTNSIPYYSHWYDKNRSSTIDHGELFQLDHFFVSPSLINKVKNRNVLKDVCTNAMNIIDNSRYYISDHCPIIMTLH